jgi:hypothetical protein
MIFDDPQTSPASKASRVSNSMGENERREKCDKGRELLRKKLR